MITQKHSPSVHHLLWAPETQQRRNQMIMQLMWFDYLQRLEHDDRNTKVMASMPGIAHTQKFTLWIIILL